MCQKKSDLHDPLHNWIVSQLWHLKKLSDAKRVVPVRVKLAETLLQPRNLNFIVAMIVLKISVIFGYIAMLQVRKFTSSGEKPSTASMGSEFFAPILRPCWIYVKYMPILPSTLRLCQIWCASILPNILWQTVLKYSGADFSCLSWNLWHLKIHLLFFLPFLEADRQAAKSILAA